MAVLFINGTARSCIQFIIHLWYLTKTEKSACCSQIIHIKYTIKLFQIQVPSYFRVYATGDFNTIVFINRSWSLPVLYLPAIEKEPKFIKTVFRQLHIENNWCLLFLSRYKACINRNRCSRHLIFICYIFFISKLFHYAVIKWK